MEGCDTDKVGAADVLRPAVLDYANSQVARAGSCEGDDVDFCGGNARCEKPGHSLLNRKRFPRTRPGDHPYLCAWIMGCGMLNSLCGGNLMSCYWHSLPLLGWLLDGGPTCKYEKGSTHQFRDTAVITEQTPSSPRS